MASGTYPTIPFPSNSILLSIQNVHGIGDRANGYVVSALEKALAGVNVTAARPRIEHAQIMTDEDIKRLGKLGGKFPLSLDGE